MISVTRSDGHLTGLSRKMCRKKKKIKKEREKKTDKYPRNPLWYLDKEKNNYKCNSTQEDHYEWIKRWRGKYTRF